MWDLDVRASRWLNRHVSTLLLDMPNFLNTTAAASVFDKGSWRVLVQRRPVPEYRRAADAIALLAQESLVLPSMVWTDGVDGRAVAGLHDAHVAGAAVPSPVEEHDAARPRLVPPVAPVFDSLRIAGLSAVGFRE